MKEDIPKKNGENPKSRRGFGSMTPEKRRRIAQLGGKAAHAKGVAHRFTSEEARIAGRKGGEKIAQNRAYMAEIGTKGGVARGKRYQRHEKETHHVESTGKDGCEGSTESAVESDRSASESTL